MPPRNWDDVDAKIAQLGVETRAALIENMARAKANRPSKSTSIGAKRELELWLLPTSPAAVAAFQRGGSWDDAEEANALWAQHLAEQGKTDEEIFAECRKFGYQRGKFHGRDDPAREAEYHDRMAGRAATWRETGRIADEQASGPADETGAAAFGSSAPGSPAGGQVTGGPGTELPA